MCFNNGSGLSILFGIGGRWQFCIVSYLLFGNDETAGIVGCLRPETQFTSHSDTTRSKHMNASWTPQKPIKTFRYPESPGLFYHTPSLLLTLPGPKPITRQLRNMPRLPTFARRKRR